MSMNIDYEKYLGKFTTKEFNLIIWSSKRKDEKVGEKKGEDVFNVYVSKDEWERKLRSEEGLSL